MRSLNELYAETHSYSETNRNRSAELAPTKPGNMFLTHSDNFDFKRFGRNIYTMPYREAEFLFTLKNDKIAAIRCLRCFRQQLSLSDCKDIVEYINANFTRPEQE